MSSSGIEEVKEAARTQARDTAAQVKEGAAHAIESAKDAGTDFIDDQKTRLAGMIDEYAHAVKAACDSLRNEDHNPLVRPADRASRQMERASEYLRGTGPVEILHDLGDFAKRNPEWVFGAMFVAGMASVRFLKASARPRRTGRNRDSGPAPGIMDSPRREPFTARPAMGRPPAYEAANPPVQTTNAPVLP